MSKNQDKILSHTSTAVCKKGTLCYLHERSIVRNPNPLPTWVVTPGHKKLVLASGAVSQFLLKHLPWTSHKGEDQCVSDGHFCCFGMGPANVWRGAGLFWCLRLRLSPQHQAFSGHLSGDGVPSKVLEWALSRSCLPELTQVPPRSGTGL